LELEELNHFRKKYETLATMARTQLEQGLEDTGTADE
jgi:hypothetical protein